MGGWRISSLLWAIAYSGLGLAAVATPVRPNGVAGSLLGGALLWVVAQIEDRYVHRRRDARGSKTTISVLLWAALVEMVACAAAGREVAKTSAYWFGIRSSFALAAGAGA